jgi:hypothetical protein
VIEVFQIWIELTNFFAQFVIGVLGYQTAERNSVQVFGDAAIVVRISRVKGTERTNPTSTLIATK